MVDAKKVQQVNAVPEKYLEAHSSGAENFGYIAAVFLIFCSVPVILARGFGGAQTAVCAVGILLFAGLAVRGRGRKRNLTEDQENFYGRLSELLEEAFAPYHPRMGEEPTKDFWSAPLDYGLLSRGETDAKRQTVGLLSQEYDGAEAEGFFFVRSYRLEQESRTQNGEKTEKEVVWRIGQGLAWRAETPAPVMPGCTLRIGRQRKSLGSDFMGQMLAGSRKQTVETGDPEFDRRFRVQSEDPDAAVRYLTPERRRTLVILWDYAGPFGVYLSGNTVTAAFAQFSVLDTQDAQKTGMGTVPPERMDSVCGQMNQIVQALPVLWEDGERQER